MDDNPPEGPPRDLIRSEFRNNYRYIHDRLFGFARAKGFSDADAADLVHEALLRALARERQYSEQPGTPLLAWLLAIARNALIDGMRKRALERTFLGEQHRHDAVRPEPPAATDEPFLKDEARQRRARLLAELTKEEREVFYAWMKQHEKIATGAEAAASVGLSLQQFEAAKKRLRRTIGHALQRLGMTTDDLRSPDRHAAEPNTTVAEEDDS